jgi:glycine cleavage system regulatory protein
MTTHESIDHGWVREHLATYLAGGLPEEERARFEAHIGGCGPCLEDLQDAQSTEKSLGNLFAGDQPGPGLEDRVIRSLRETPAPRIRASSSAYRIAGVIAAVVLMGVVGFLFETGESQERSDAAARSGGGLQKAEAVRRDELNTRSAPLAWAPSASYLAKNKVDELLARLKDSPSFERRREGLDRQSDGVGAAYSMAEEGKGRDAEQAFRGEGGGARKAFKELDRTLGGEPQVAASDPDYFKPGAAAEPPRPAGPGSKSEPTSAPEKRPRQDDKKPPAQDPPAPQRRITRQGELEFEVDSFDSSVDKVSRIVAEEKGFVATVNSDRLPNGKVKGTIVLRVPPESLDRLVLKLRALGELKSQRITSEDITKKYYDLEGMLKAARTMEARLIEIIKTGKGEIKDILAAEKELGVWREKIELFEGELRFYTNLISLSTLTLTLVEKDIRTPSTVTMTETVDTGIEAEDVLKADKDLRAMIADAKGRITASDLKKLAADQFSLQISCEVPPENAGSLRDRLNQLGRVARLDVQTQTSDDGRGRPVEAKVKRNDTVFRISVYNITNVQPRETSHLNLACIDVEAVFKAIISRVGLAGGRVVQSNLNRVKADQIDGLVQFEVPAKDGDAVVAELRRLGEVMNFKVIENPDSANVTKSKKGFNVVLLAMAHVIARETTSIRFAAKEVADSYRQLQALVLEKKGRILDAQLNEVTRDDISASLDFELPRDERVAFDEALRARGQILSQTVQRAPDDGRVVDSKVRISMSLQTVKSVGPRRTVKLGVEVSDVDRTAEQITALVSKADGTLVDSQNSRDASGRVVSYLVFEAPLAASNGIVEAIRKAGTVRLEETKRNPNAPENELAIGRIELTLSNADPLVASNEGFIAQVKAGLRSVIAAAGFSLKLILIGLLIVVPWALIIWGSVKVARRFRSKPAPGV